MIADLVDVGQSLAGIRVDELSSQHRAAGVDVQPNQRIGKALGSFAGLLWRFCGVDLVWFPSWMGLNYPHCYGTLPSICRDTLPKCTIVIWLDLL